MFPIPAGVAAVNTAKQSVTIPGYFKMRSRFVDYAGSYVMHCHILAHEDRGMMMEVDLAVNNARGGNSIVGCKIRHGAGSWCMW